MAVKRLRIIAGPNGSGKTTLYFFLKGKFSTGIWLNADELLEHVSKKGFIEYSVLGFSPTEKIFRQFCKKQVSQKFITEFKLQGEIDMISFGQFSLSFAGKNISNETAAFLTDYFRYWLLQNNVSFTTETVLSHPSKLELVKAANKKQYKTYLYFIATGSPEINIGRIKGRVYKGGHPVGREKVIGRYEKSITLLKKSINIFDRVFIFDNSGVYIELIASYANSKLEYIYTEKIPDWLNFLISDNSE
jgi:predicted ABC-type ATPase